jgi:F0F1-type ATP synthase assembly protein I
MGDSRPNLYDIAFRRTVFRLVLIQVVLVFVAAGIAFPLKGTNFVMALLYGGGASLAGTLLGAWRVRVATDEAAHDVTLGMAELYKGVLFRFVLVITLLALGMGLLQLSAAGVLTGFVVAQVGNFFARPLRAR